MNKIIKITIKINIYFSIKFINYKIIKYMKIYYGVGSINYIIQ